MSTIWLVRNGSMLASAAPRLRLIGIIVALALVRWPACYVACLEAFVCSFAFFASSGTSASLRLS